MTVKIFKHEAMPKCGSYEVRFSDGRLSKFFYWDDEPGRRLRPEKVSGKKALQAAKIFARSMRDTEE